MSIFTPSEEQSQIFSHIGAPSPSNLLVSACPGSGKTTTIMQSFQHVPRASGFVPTRIIYLVFNKRNADEAKDKVARMGVSVEVSTFHSLGMRALKDSGACPRNVKVDSRKVPRLVWNAMARENPDIQGVIKLVSLLKSCSGREADDDRLADLSGFHEIDFAEPQKAFITAMKVLEKSTQDVSTIDFDDMLYLPVVLNIPFAPADWVFTDECQDTNEVQSEILFRLARKEYSHTQGKTFSFEHRTNPTKFVFVGDPHQAIYGFRGASSDAMTKLKTRFACHELPLSVSFRCPKAVVKEAQRYI